MKFIVELLKKDFGIDSEISEDTSLQDDLLMYGDDIHDFLEKYSNEFNVDLSNYLWYFHTGEEGCNPFSILFKPPNHQVDQIPITIKLLEESAKQGKWCVEYPEHTISKRRWDIIVLKIFVLALFILIVALIYKNS